MRNPEWDGLNWDEIDKLNQEKREKSHNSLYDKLINTLQGTPMNTISTFNIGSDLDYIELEEPNVEQQANKFLSNQSTALNLVECADNGQVYHPVQGMMQYLALAYNNHKGVYITPEQIWLTTLSQLSSIVNQYPEDFREFFTDSAEKEDIVVGDSGTNMIDVNLIVDELRKRIKFDADILFPKITEVDPNYQFTVNASFAEMSSPYYNYSMMMCGFRFIKVVGERSDWHNIIQAIKQIKILFDNEVVNHYLDGVNDVLRIILSPSTTNDKMTEMFWTEKCGSGHQVEVKGWFQGMYLDIPSLAYVNNFHTGISKVEYRKLVTGEDFQLFTGLLGAIHLEEDDALIPTCQYILAKAVTSEASQFDDNNQGFDFKIEKTQVEAESRVLPNAEYSSMPDISFDDLKIKMQNKVLDTDALDELYDDDADESIRSGYVDTDALDELYDEDEDEDVWTVKEGKPIVRYGDTIDAYVQMMAEMFMNQSSSGIGINDLLGHPFLHKLSDDLQIKHHTADYELEYEGDDRAMLEFVHERIIKSPVTSYDIVIEDDIEDSVVDVNEVIADYSRQAMIANLNAVEDAKIRGFYHDKYPSWGVEVNNAINISDI